jgi:hypothetical protein
VKPRIEHVAEMDEAIRSEPFVPTRAESLERLFAAVESAKAEGQRLRLLRTRLQMIGTFFFLVGVGMIAAFLFGPR